MARLLTVLVLALGACTPEPRVHPQRVYLDVTDYCIDAVLRMGTEGIDLQTLSADLFVVDASSLPGRPVTLGRSPCSSVEVTANVAEVRLHVLASMLELLDGLPNLPVGGQYGLVGGIYLNDADCAESGGTPWACGMSGPFGGLPYDPEADGGAGRLSDWLLCSSANPCLTSDDCAFGVCDVPIAPGPCARDEQCRGSTCGDDGVCVEHECRRGGEPCLGRLCRSDATCDPDHLDCQASDGAACAPWTCQDSVPGEALAPAYDISFPVCSSLYGDALASD